MSPAFSATRMNPTGSGHPVGRLFSSDAMSPADSIDRLLDGSSGQIRPALSLARDQSPMTLVATESTAVNRSTANAS